MCIFIGKGRPFHLLDIDSRFTWYLQKESGFGLFLFGNFKWWGRSAVLGKFNFRRTFFAKRGMIKQPKFLWKYREWKRCRFSFPNKLYYL